MEWRAVNLAYLKAVTSTVAGPSFNDLYVYMEGTEGGAWVRRDEVITYEGNAAVEAWKIIQPTLVYGGSFAFGYDQMLGAYCIELGNNGVYTRIYDGGLVTTVDINNKTVETTFIDVASSDRAKDWDPLSPKDVETLNAMGIVIGGTTVLGYTAGGPEVGAVVNKITSVPATIIAVTTTVDSWADYSRSDKSTGDLVRAWSCTIITAVGVVYWPLAIPACIFGIGDQNGWFDKLWKKVDELTEK